jgi:hypothetical protein
MGLISNILNSSKQKPVLSGAFQDKVFGEKKPLFKKKEPKTVLKARVGENLTDEGKKKAELAIENQVLAQKSERANSTGGIITNAVKASPRVAGKVVANILQGTARTVGTVGVTAGNAPARALNRVVGSEKYDVPFDRETPTEGNKITKAVFGGEPVRDFKTAGENAVDIANSLASAVAGKEVSPISKKLSPLLAVAGTVLDLSGGGKTVKSFVDEVPDAFLKQVAKTSDEAALEATYRQIGMQNEDQIKMLVNATKDAKTVDEVKKAIINLNDAPQEGIITKSLKGADRSPGAPGSEVVPQSTQGIVSRTIAPEKAVLSDTPTFSNEVGTYKNSEKKVKEIKNQLNELGRRSNLTSSEEGLNKLNIERERLESELATAENILKDTSEKTYKFNDLYENFTTKELAEPAEGISFRTPLKDGEYYPIKKTQNGYVAVDKKTGEMIDIPAINTSTYNSGGWKFSRDTTFDDKTVAEVLDTYAKKTTTPEVKVETPTPKAPEPVQSKVNKEDLKLQIEFMEERMASHPGKRLRKFISRKEGQFEDFADPDRAKTPAKRKFLMARNEKIKNVAEAVFDGNPALRGAFDDPDVIRAQIEEYQGMKEELDGLKDELKTLPKEIKKPFTKSSSIASFDKDGNMINAPSEKLLQAKKQKANQATSIRTARANEIASKLEQGSEIKQEELESLRSVNQLPEPTEIKDLKIPSYTDTLSSQPQSVKEAENSALQFDFKDTPPSDPVFGELIQGLSPDLIQDISGFTGQTRDFFRNVEHVFRTDYTKSGPTKEVVDAMTKKRRDAVEKLILDPFDKAKGEYVDTQLELVDRLKKEIVEKYGFKKGSKESAAIMDYGERNLEGEFAPARPLLREELVRMFGKEKADQIVEADAWFRKEYDTLVDKVNAERKEIYGRVWEKKANLDEEIELLEGKLKEKQSDIDSKKRTDTLTYTKLNQQKERLENAVQRRKDLMESELWWRGKLVPKRNDYYRHFQELSQGFKALKNIITEDAKIASNLSGISPDTKPKSKFLKFAQKRLGNTSERDAVGGFIDYIPSASYAIHIDPQINRFRQLAKELAEFTQESKNLNNFIEHIQDFANHLAGKSNDADRFVQKIVSRKVMRALNWLNSRIKANQIVGNVSSAVAQAFNIPQGVGVAKQHSIGGLKRSLAQIFTENKPMAQSTFIKERYKMDMYDQFDEGIFNNTRKFAVWMTGALDEVGTKFIWNSMYEKAIKEKMQNPIKFADNQTRKLVAGRGIGEQPLLQKSQLFQIVAPFQLEVGNLWWVLKDQVKKKDFTGLAIFMLTVFLMNKAAEEIRGNDVALDPIQATIDGIKAFKNEDNKVVGGAKFLGRIGGEILSNIPLGQNVASSYPEQGFKKLGPLTGVTREELFGSNDPTRFGNGLSLTKGLQDPIFKVLPPFGGAQIKKTKEGIQAFREGEVRNKSGKLTTEVEKKPMNAIRMGLFGKYATKETQDSFKNQDDLRLRVERQETRREEVKQNAEEKWKELKKLGEEDQALAAQAFEKLIEEDPTLAEKVLEVYESEQLGLDAEDRLIKTLGVENGERAQYIYDMVMELETQEERAAFYGDLIEKKLVSEAVSEQIASLVENAKQ